MAEDAISHDLRSGARTAIFVAMAAAHGAVLLGMIWTLGLRQRESEPAIMTVEVLRLPQLRPTRAAPGRKGRGPSERAAAPSQSWPMMAPAPISPAVAADRPAALGAGVRDALRKRLGCSDAELLHLTRSERAKCDEQLALGGRDPGAMPIGIDPAKEAAFAAGSWRNREPILARTPHNGCDPNLSEREFAHGGVGRQDWRVGVGCAVSLDKVGRALGFSR